MVTTRARLIKVELSNGAKAALIRAYVRERLHPLPPIEEDPLWEMVGADDSEPARVDDVVYPR